MSNIIGLKGDSFQRHLRWLTLRQLKDNLRILKGPPEHDLYNRALSIYIHGRPSDAENAEQKHQNSNASVA